MTQIISAMLALVLSAGTAAAFPCANPKPPWDIVVCSDTALQKLADERLTAFNDAKARLSPEQFQRLREDQNAWVHSYSASCGIRANRAPPSPIPIEIVECFRRAGEARLAYLQSYGSEDGSSPSRSPREDHPTPTAPTISQRGEKTLDAWIDCLHDAATSLAVQPEPARTVVDGALGTCGKYEIAFFNATVKTGEIDRPGFERAKDGAIKNMIGLVMRGRAARAKLPKENLETRPDSNAITDYTGPFTTKILYTMCSQEDRASRDRCDIYIQGLMYGINISRSLESKLHVCLPEMSIEAARTRILQFIDTTTGGKPETNGDGGDWMAFMGLAAGNLCKD